MSYLAIGPLYRKLEARAEMLAREHLDTRRHEIAFHRSRHSEILLIRRQRAQVARVVRWFKSVPSRSILAEVAAKHGLTVADLKSAKRTQYFCTPRFEAAYRLKTERGLSLSQIGTILGGRDHTTALHAVRTHAALNGLPLP